jgi:hypothetical protein
LFLFLINRVHLPPKLAWICKVNARWY